MGISYNGRTYDEGKKIGWRDGVRAVVCILKYSRTGARLRVLGGDAPAVSSPVSSSTSPTPPTAAGHGRAGAEGNGARPDGGDRSPV